MITKKQEPCTKCDSSEKELYCSYCERCSDCCGDWEKHGRMSMAEKGHAISFNRTWDAIKKDDDDEERFREGDPYYGPAEPERLLDENMVFECKQIFLSTLRPLLENQDQNSYVRNVVSDDRGNTPTDEEIEAGRHEAIQHIDRWLESIL